MITQRGIEANPDKIRAILEMKSLTAEREVLKGAETCYSLAEQLVFVLIVAVRKLRPYFQSHTVQVMTNQHVKQILHRPEMSKRRLKWAIELSEFDIEFKPRTAIKAHVLADFIVELTMPPSIPDDKCNTPSLETLDLEVLSFNYH
ncbi:reverse transcriptase [Abeliophyllum distichum]|uniref:Reverse transcriptase n=1 Tax=Abeliophyllum distichum TaxID=126358 RepID=A0ABD1UQR5_9LAMI